MCWSNKHIRLLVHASNHVQHLRRSPRQDTITGSSCSTLIKSENGMVSSSTVAAYATQAAASLLVSWRLLRSRWGRCWRSCSRPLWQEAPAATGREARARPSRRWGGTACRARAAGAPGWRACRRGSGTAGTTAWSTAAATTSCCGCRRRCRRSGPSQAPWPAPQRRWRRRWPRGRGRAPRPWRTSTAPRCRPPARTPRGWSRSRSRSRRPGTGPAAPSPRLPSPPWSRRRTPGRCWRRSEGAWRDPGRRRGWRWSRRVRAATASASAPWLLLDGFLCFRRWIGWWRDAWLIRVFIAWLESSLVGSWWPAFRFWLLLHVGRVQHLYHLSLNYLL